MKFNGESASRYWQHRTPLRCPKRHVMGWLGLGYWICATCHTIFVQVPPGQGEFEVEDPRDEATIGQ